MNCFTFTVVLFHEPKYRKSPIYKHLNCKLLEIQTHFSLWIFVDANKSWKQLLCLTRYCHSCAVVCWLQCKRAQQYSAQSEPRMSGSRRKSSSDVEGTNRKCKAITTATKVKTIERLVWGKKAGKHRSFLQHKLFNHWHSSEEQGHYFCLCVWFFNALHYIFLSKMYKIHFIRLVNESDLRIFSPRTELVHKSGTSFNPYWNWYKGKHITLNMLGFRYSKQLFLRIIEWI